MSYQGSLEDEIRRYNDYQNRDTTFQLSRINDEINHLKRRATLAQEESKSGKGDKYLTQYIAELNEEVKRLEQQQEIIGTQESYLQLTHDQLTLIRDKLRNFVQRIKIEPSDQQHRLLKEYVTEIVADQFTGGFKLACHIQIPDEFSEKAITVLEKTIYFCLD